jgi:ABC-2 type transport system ATP-binding protein
MTSITVLDAAKSYRGNLLYQGVNLDFEAGKMYALLGPNGSGKSVLLRMLCGFTKPDRGAVIFDERLTAQGRTFPDRFGIMIDGPAFIPGLTAEQNLMELARIRKRVGLVEVREVLEQVGLQGTGAKRARNFSAGMKQKLGLAQAFMEDPEVLILDEPFTALDSDSAAVLRAQLMQKRDDGCTIIFTTHGEADFLAQCDGILQIAGSSINSVGGNDFV